MTTATTNRAVTAPAAVDFDTRLTLASAGMDAVLRHRHGDALAGARAAAEAALSSVPEPGPEDEPETHPLLARAADLIRVRGWTQGTYESADGRLCAIGALQLAATGELPDSYQDAERVLVDRITREIGREMTVPAWNDSRTDVSQVLKLVY